MTAFRRRPNKKNWARFALKLGLLATDASVLGALGRMLTERNDAHETLRPRERLITDLHSHRGWSHTSTLLLGFGIGVGVGMLFAPVSGEQARNAIREKATNVRERVTEVALWAGRNEPPAGRRSTGTYAE